MTASTLDCAAGDPLDLAVEELAELPLGYRLAAEPDAIDECYATLSPLVLGYLRRLLPHHEAEDALPARPDPVPAPRGAPSGCRTRRCRAQQPER